MSTATVGLLDTRWLRCDGVVIWFFRKKEMGDADGPQRTSQTKKVIDEIYKYIYW